MSSAATHPGPHWVELAPGVRYDRTWLAARTPQLLVQWERAGTDADRLLLARRVQHAAAWAESEANWHPVTVRWTQTSHFEADIVLHPAATVEDVLAAIEGLDAADRRVTPPAPDHVHLVGVATSPAAGAHWAALADRIDPRLTAGPDWPPLAASLDLAAAAGVDVTGRLTALAAAGPLPERHPARELHWRLLADCPEAAPRNLGHPAPRVAAARPGPVLAAPAPPPPDPPSR